MLGFSPLASAPLADDGVDIRSVNRVPVTGVQGTLQSPDVQPNITEILSGVFGQGFGNGVTVKVLQPISTPQLIGEVEGLSVGQFEVDVSEVIATGVSASALVNSTKQNTLEKIAGVSATVQAGQVSVTGTAFVLVGGVQATGAVNTISFNAVVNIASVEATFESPNFTVNVSESLGSVSAISEVGLVQPSFSDVAVVAGVSATGSADTVVVNVATVLVGVVGTLVVGTPEIKPTEIVLSVQATGAVSQVQANTGTTLTTPTLTLIIGDVTRTAEVFNFEAVKETYSRQRTVILPRVA